MLFVADRYLDFGDVCEDESFVWTMPIENRGSTPVCVESFRKTCNCMSVRPASFTVEPGERRQLELQIDLASRPQSSFTVGLWPRVIGNDGKPETTDIGMVWMIRGQVRRAIAIPQFAPVGQHSELAQPLAAFSVALRQFVDLESLTAGCENPAFTIAFDSVCNSNGG